MIFILIISANQNDPKRGAYTCCYLALAQQRARRALSNIYRCPACSLFLAVRMRNELGLPFLDQCESF